MCVGFFSSFVAVKAVLRNYHALFLHFTECSTDSSRAGKEKSKYAGLAKKLQNWLFVSEACMIKDALRCLKQFSLYLQSNQASIIDVLSHLEILKNKLLALKDENGQSLDKFISSFNAESSYKAVEIVMNDNDVTRFQSVKCQFFQALHNNVVQRFPCNDLLNAASCLNQSTWPMDPLSAALFGEAEVAKLCKMFGFESSQAAEILMQYGLYKRHGGKSIGQKLKALVDLLKVLPVSSADCERGFSQMNLYHTSGRNRLLVQSVNDMMMIGINGPLLHAWNASKYVISWIKSGRHGALDKPTGLPSNKEVVSHSSKLFL